uniref:Uncharacterized protein n=1 Tax=Dunaliella tertiolecta TaxID=3047 RepID=A0A7S3VKA1_DUNTE
MDEDDEAEGRRYLLEPNWVALKPRIQGFPAFAQFINARADNRLEVRLQQLKAPAVGAYDMEGAWEFIQRHVPQVCMRFAADRWRTRDVMEGLARGGDRAAYELSLAADAVIRLQPPAWSFAPLPYDKERLEEEARQRRERHGLKAGFGPMLSWDPEEGLALVKPRPPGALPFELQPARDDGAAQAKRTRHLGPGTYDVRHDVVERQGPAFDFSRHQGHGILPSSSDEDEGEQPLPEGAILSLDVLPAKDAVLKRPRFPVHMGAMQGRDDEPQSPSKYGAYTNHLGLPDPDLDLVKAGRHRVQQVLMDIGPGHESLAPPSSPEAAKRGPGAYDLEGHNTLGNTGPAFDFGRAVGHDPVSPKANKDPLEGNRLSLDSPGAVDRVRPRARAALFLPEGAGGEAAAARRQLAGSDGCLDPRAYQDAMYEPDYDQVRPVAPRPLRFSLQVGRPQPKARPDTWALDYKAEDVPLSVLAGYPGVRKVPDFAAMQPHKPMGPTRPKLEGDRLDLDPMTALDTTKAQPRGIPAMDTQAEGHMDPTRMGTGAPPEQSEWLNYNPRFTLVKASTSPAPNMGRGLDREAAQKADPRAGEDVTGDLDGGVYNVKHGQVWASPRAVDFQRGQPHGSPTQNRTDPDEGNVLWLDPKLPQIGWSPEPSIPHTKQPMGKAPERWSADPVILDDGNVLKLRLSLDDLSHLRDRPTKVNAPVTAFGAMRANRYEQVLKPNENLAIPGVLQPKFTNQTMEATLAMEPRHDQVFEVFRKAPHSPAAEALRRADRVMARFQRGQLEQHLQRQEQQKWQLPMQDQDQNYGQRCGHDFGLQAGHEQDQLHELERQQPQQQQHLQPGMVRQLRRRAQRQLEQLQARAGKDERQQQQLPQQPYVQPSQHHQQQQQQQQERLPQQPGSQPSQQQQQQQQQQQKTLIRDLTGPPPAPPPGFPFQQWLPPTSQARAAAAEGGEVGGGVALPHAPSHPSLVGRKDYAAKQQLVPRGPRERAALRDIQNTVRQEAHVHQTTAQGAAPAAGAGGAGDGSTGDHAVQASRWPPVNAGGAFQKVVYPQPHPEAPPKGANPAAGRPP